jgi:S1-C subfamily serine protease
MLSSIQKQGRMSSTGIIALIFIAGLIIGGLATASFALRQINDLETEVSNLEAQVSKLWGFQNVTIDNGTIYQNGTDLSLLYESVKESVVLISGSAGSGSGFVYDFDGSMFVITNNHVVTGNTGLSVAFSNGNGYAASVNGTDKYSDLAVVTVNAPLNEFKPLEIASSSTLTVGEPVAAVGNPYQLVGSMTTGIVSALGRTISEQEYTGGFAIANIIQTSAPINPGNSGGPLLDFQGRVVGITTAIINDSQGLGFAVPSNTILREIESLVTTGGYSGHSYLGLRGQDMDYAIAQETGLNVTYGWRVVDYIDPSPARDGGVNIGDVLVAMNGTRLRNADDMASYMEEKTLPGETVMATVVREVQGESAEVNLEIVLGTRP